MAEASAHLEEHREEEAAAAWAEAAEVADRRVDREEALYRRARLQLRLGHHAEALRALDDLAAARPISRRTVRATFDAAVFRLDHGERERSIAALTWVVEEHPESGLAGRALRLLLEAASDAPPAEVAAWLDVLYGRVGSSDLGDDVLTHRARILRAAGDRAGAVQALERLAADHPYPHGQRWDDALWTLADLALEADDPERAAAYLRRMIAEVSGDILPGGQIPPLVPRASLRLGRLYRDELADPRRAEATFRATASRFPKSLSWDDALADLGELQLAQGRLVEGCATLERLLAATEVGRARRRAARLHAEACDGSGGS